MMAIAGVMINPKVEEYTEEEGKLEEGGFFNSLKLRFQEVKEALKIDLIYRTLGFLLISSLLFPTFSSFMYYFQLDIVEFSKFTQSMLLVIGFVTLFIGTVLYKMYF